MNNLVRVQLYLNPENLSLVDEVAKDLKVSRSQIIRDAVTAAVDKYSETVRLIKMKTKPNLKLWMDMVGIEKSKTGTVGLNVDEIYLND